MNGLFRLQVLVDLADRLSGPLSGPIAKLAALEQHAQTADRAIKAIGAGAAIGAVGLGIGAGLGAAVRPAMDFQTSIANIATETNQTTAQLMPLGQQILQLSNQIGKSATDLAAGLYDVIGASVKGTERDNGLSVLAISAKAATAGLTETRVATDIITSSLNAYGMDANRAGYVSDVLFKTVAVGKTTFDELSRSMGLVLPTASAVGVTFNELNAAVAALTANGMRTSLAVEYTRGALANIIRPSHEAAKEAARLGLDFSAAALKAEGFSKFLERVKVATNGNIHSMSLLFGSVEATNAILALTSQDGLARFKDALAQIGGSAGATEIAYQKIALTTQAAWNRFVQSLRNLAIQGGSVLLPVLNDLLNGATRWIGGLNAALQPVLSFLQAHQGLARVLGILPLALAAVLVGVALLVTGLAGLSLVSSQARLGLAFLRETFGSTTTATNTLNFSLSTLRLRLATLGGIIPATRSAILSLVGAVRAFTLSLLTNPVFLIIAAVMGLGYAFVWAWGHVQEFRNQVLVALLPLRRAWADFLAALSQLRGQFQPVVAYVRSAFGGIDNLLGMLAYAFGFVLGFVLTLTIGVFARIGAAILQNLTGVVTIARGWVNIIVGLFTGNFDRVRTGAAQVMDGLVLTITSPLRLLGQNAVDWGKNIVEGLINGIQSRIAAVGNAIGNTVEMVKQVFTGKTQMKSPSRLFAFYGTMLTAGLAQGIHSGSGEVTQAVANLAQRPSLQAETLIAPTLRPRSAQSNPATATSSRPAVVVNIANIAVGESKDPKKTVAEMQQAIEEAVLLALEKAALEEGYGG